jgi:hypothetical protein
MVSEKKKANVADNIEAFEIKLERVPVENLAEVTETLDRVRTAAQKLVGKLAEEADRFDKGEINDSRLEHTATSIGKALTMLNQGMRTVLSAAAAKEKLNSVGNRRNRPK